MGLQTLNPLLSTGKMLTGNRELKQNATKHISEILNNGSPINSRRHCVVVLEQDTFILA